MLITLHLCAYTITKDSTCKVLGAAFTQTWIYKLCNVHIPYEDSVGESLGSTLSLLSLGTTSRPNYFICFLFVTDTILRHHVLKASYVFIIWIDNEAAGGRCAQRTYNVTLLRRTNHCEASHLEDGELVYVEQWRPYVKTVGVGCECEIHPWAEALVRRAQI